MDHDARKTVGNDTQVVPLEHNFVTFCSIAFPTMCLKVFFYSTTILGHRDNVIYLKQKVWLGMGRIMAITTCEMVSLLDKITQLPCHQRPLFFCKSRSGNFLVMFGGIPGSRGS